MIVKIKELDKTNALVGNIITFVSGKWRASSTIKDEKTVKTGLVYAADYSVDLKANDRSLTDVGTVKVLRQSVNSWATAGRPSTPAVGDWGYNTTTSKHEGWNGSLWNAFY